jgi:uncharacterized membrane protein YqjE
MTQKPSQLQLEEASTKDLVHELLDETKELVRIEVELAKSEVQLEIKHAKMAGVGFGIAGAAAILFLSSLVVAVILALGGTPLAALGTAAVLLVIAGLAGWLAYSALPKKPLERTRERVTRDVRELKEHIA